MLLDHDPLDLLCAHDDALDYLRTLLARPWWHALAECGGRNLSTFFPTRGDSTEPARAICATCPVQTECAADALADPDRRGVFGGTSARLRERARDEGWTVDHLVAAAFTRREHDASPSPWTTEPCRGCGGLLSRRDLDRVDGWCWACRP